MVSVLLFCFSLSKSFADCTVTSSTTFAAFFSSNTCSGKLIIPNGVVLSLSGNFSVPGTVNQIVIENGGQIDWVSNNSTLTLQPNTAIVIKNTSTTSGTNPLEASPCNNTKRIKIGTSEYAACSGGGNTCILFDNLIAAGGTLIPEATISLAGGANGQACFPAFGLDVAVSGFSLATPTYLWSQTSGPGTSSFGPSAATKSPSVTVTTPGTYVYKVEVTDPGNASCATVSKATNSLTVVVRPTPSASLQISGPSYCVNALPPVVTFTNPVAFPITISYNINGGSAQTINVGASSTTLVAASTAMPGTFTYNLVSVQYATAPFCAPVAISGAVSYTVGADATLALTSAIGTDAQALCANSSPIANITYAIGGGGTGAVLSGSLPDGVTGTYQAGIFTISGTPTSQGQYDYIITTTGSCAQTSLSGSINTTSAPAPATPGAIAGPANVCPGAFALNYTIDPVAGADTYNWTVPTGWTITSGQGTTAIIVTAGGDNTSGNVTVAAQNSCGTSTAQSLPVTSDDITPPETPALADLNGECSVTPSVPSTTDACAGTINGTTTTIFPITATTVITWTFDDGNGNTTTASQNVTITPLTPTLALTSVTGTDAQTLCANSSPIANITYAIGGGGTGAVLSGSLPDGVTGTYQAGIFTISGTPTSQGQYAYAITATGSCAQTSLSGSINILSAPATSGAIAGPADACPGTTGLTYSIDPVSGAETYVWTAPTGWTITSGQGTTSITVTAGGDNTSGNVTVAAQNSCGTSTTQSLPVTADDITPSVTPILVDLNGECSVTPSVPSTTDACAGIINGTTTTVFPITAMGTTTITWTFDDGNGNTTTADQKVRITPLTISPITGPANMNRNDVATMTDATVGGVWSVNNDNAVIDPVSGQLTAMAAGEVTVLYTVVSNQGCPFSVSHHITIVASALPVELVSFTGRKTGDTQATLQWTTSEETAFQEFEIQKSADLQSFEVMGRIAGGSGKVGALNHYQFLDRSVTWQNNYYRLKMVDRAADRTDGTFEYSKIIHLEGAQVENDIVGAVYPNPASTGQASIDVWSNHAGYADMVLFSVSGLVLKKERLTVTAGMNKLTIRTEMLRNAIYFLQVDVNAKSHSRKMVIMK